MAINDRSKGKLMKSSLFTADERSIYNPSEETFSSLSTKERGKKDGEGEEKKRDGREKGSGHSKMAINLQDFWKNISVFKWERGISSEQISLPFPSIPPIFPFCV